MRKYWRVVDIISRTYSIIVLSASTVVSVEINWRHYFRIVPRNMHFRDKILIREKMRYSLIFKYLFSSLSFSIIITKTVLGYIFPKCIIHTMFIGKVEKKRFAKITRTDLSFYFERWIFTCFLSLHLSKRTSYLQTLKLKQSFNENACPKFTNR